MEDETLETVLWSSSALAISSGTEQLLMLKGFTDPSREVYLSKHKHIFKNSKFMFNILFTIGAFLSGRSDCNPIRTVIFSCLTKLTLPSD